MKLKHEEHAEKISELDKKMKDQQLNNGELKMTSQRRRSSRDQKMVLNSAAAGSQQLLEQVNMN